MLIKDSGHMARHPSMTTPSAMSLLLLVQATTRFKEVALPGKPSYYRTDESPDFWFPPTEVWEIRGADLTVSPVHKAAVGHIHPDRGISLRSVLAIIALGAVP